MPKGMAAGTVDSTFYMNTLPFTLRPLSGFQQNKNKEKETKIEKKSKIYIKKCRTYWLKHVFDWS